MLEQIGLGAKKSVKNAGAIWFWGEISTKSMGPIRPPKNESC